MKTPNLDDIKELRTIELPQVNLPPDALRSRAGSAYTFHKDYFKDFLRDMKMNTLEDMGEGVETLNQAAYYKGCLAMLELIALWFKEQEGIIKENSNVTASPLDEESVPSV